MEENAAEQRIDELVAEADVTVENDADLEAFYGKIDDCVARLDHWLIRGDAANMI